MFLKIERGGLFLPSLWQTRFLHSEWVTSHRAFPDECTKDFLCLGFHELQWEESLQMLLTPLTSADHSRRVGLSLGACICSCLKARKHAYFGPIYFPKMFHSFSLKFYSVWDSLINLFTNVLKIELLLHSMNGLSIVNKIPQSSWRC
jgi:hypothetical protein